MAVRVGQALVSTLLSATLLTAVAVAEADASPGRLPENTTIATAPGAYVPLTSPVRVLDTRAGIGARGPLAGGSVIQVGLAGAGVPANASAVIVNVTATEPTAPGYVTVYPWAPGAVAPTASNLNFLPGDSIPNLVAVQLGSSSSIAMTVALAGTTHLVADVAGYYVGGSATANGAFVPVKPARLLDTRQSVAVGGNSSIVLQVAGLGGVPATGAGSVFVNATVTQPGAPGYLTLYPYGASAPTVSNVNFVAGETVPNLASVKLGSGGQIVVSNGSPQPAHVVVDVFGYVLSNSKPSVYGSFVPLTPSRQYDTRDTPAGPDPMRAGERMPLYTPAGVIGMVSNVTVTEPRAPGFVVAYPGIADPASPSSTTCGTPPSASNVNFVAGETVPNLVAVATGGPGNVACFANGSAAEAHFVLDLAGVYVDPAVFGKSELSSTSAFRMLRRH